MVIVMGIELYKKYEDMTEYIHKILHNYLLSPQEHSSSIYINLKNLNFRHDDVYEGLNIAYDDIKDIIDNIVIELCHF